MNYITYFLYIIEDIKYYTLNMNIDICYWTYIISSLTTEYLFEFIIVFLKVEYNIKSCSDDNIKTEPCNTSYCQKDVKVYKVNKKDHCCFWHGKVIQSNLVFSMSAKPYKNNNGMDNIMNADTDTYTAAIDRCTSESICRQKELFVGEIKQCKNVYVQGVGGKIKASGFG
jgi:hypothetical protein